MYGNAGCGEVGVEDGYEFCVGLFSAGAVGGWYWWWGIASGVLEGGGVGEVR